MRTWILILLSLASLLGSFADECGSPPGGALCPRGLCCNENGSCLRICTTGPPQCGSPPGGAPCPGRLCCDHNSHSCQYRCTTQNSTTSGVASIITPSLFDQMLKHRNDPTCQGKGFYTYNAFSDAANAFDGFGTVGNVDTRKREIAAFLAHTSHETNGKWATAPGDQYSWGYCLLQKQGKNPVDYCVASAEFPCAYGKEYHGRGPIQISYNYNYGPTGKAIGANLLTNPDLVSTDAIVSFKTAIWYWMTSKSEKPSCHDTITGRWTPSNEDKIAGRLPGFGVSTNIINGGLECGKGNNVAVANRIGFYKRYCDILGVSYGTNLDCYNQKPFA
ncbi:basic endochitinase C-like [Tasmannia lanceolata]|uniref:basic endochitinase C-like n=1 Tax=Tasmannia lanceolata TaxID=3420 RepID=UPI00406357FE